MAIPKNKNFSDYDNYLTDADPTTAAQAQDYFKNQAELLKAVIDSGYWQPETRYAFGAVVKSDSMPSGTEAVCVAENGGLSSSVEPSWGEVGGANVSDGTCFWQLRYTGTVTSVNGARPDKEGDVIVPVMQGSTSTTNGVEGLVPAPSAGSEEFPLVGSGEFKNILGFRTPNTDYALGAVVACPYHAEFYLKCTQAGKTADGALDTTNVTKGQVITDGGVKWLVYNPLDDYLPANGGVMWGGIRKNGLAEELNLFGGTSFENGACIALYGGECNAGFGKGAFLIRACSEVGKLAELVGKPDGTLLWGGKDLRTKRIIGAKADGSISFGDNYEIRSGYKTTQESEGRITFLTPFPTACLGVFPALFSEDLTEPRSITIKSRDVTGFEFKQRRQHSSSTTTDSTAFAFIAIGY